MSRKLLVPNSNRTVTGAGSHGMRCGRPRRMRLDRVSVSRGEIRRSQAAPTGTNVTVRAPALVSSPSASTAGRVKQTVVDFKPFRSQCGGHLLAPFHQDDGMLARILQFLVQAERFQFVQ